ncbi:MAG: DUF502 domain-containing protein [Thermoanaerobaculales bacterium]|jgi:uncharacterized membrane protein|nr:DUF502 domain-containing protein [Thermoanaerobaculales bacterium]
MTDSNTPNDGFFRRLAVNQPEDGPVLRRLGRWIRRRFAVGFLVVLPMVITLFFARFIFRLLDEWFLPISERIFGVEIPGLGFALFIILLFILGIIATNLIGGRLLDFFERRVAGIPLLSPVYQGARQITEAIQIRGTTDFRKVVMLEFPRDGLRSIGFVTREFSGATEFCGEPSALVFVPTTPNPTSGFLVAVPQRELEVLDITVEQGVKLLISGGLLTPAELLQPSKEITAE